MRRKDREITDILEIKEMIKKCDCIHIGMCLDNVPYVCTMNFGMLDQGELCFFMHCANEGHKINILKQQPLVSFVMNCEHQYIENIDAKKATMEYLSVAGMGIIEFVDDLEEKINGLNCLVAQYSKNVGSYDENTLKHVTVLKMRVREISGKRHKKEKSNG